MTDTYEASVGQEWAEMIRGLVDAERADLVMIDIVEATNKRRANRADVTIACALILGQSIATACPEDAKGIRAGIMAMIDGFAMRMAVSGGDD